LTDAKANAINVPKSASVTSLHSLFVFLKVLSVHNISS